MKTCAGCDHEIVPIPHETPFAHWYVEVHTPHGRSVKSGPYCLRCMVRLAEVGVRLYNHPSDTHVVRQQDAST